MATPAQVTEEQQHSSSSSKNRLSSSRGSNRSRSSSGSSSRCGQRFGQKSTSAFFTRHNPHPSICVHYPDVCGKSVHNVVEIMPWDFHRSLAHVPRQLSLQTLRQQLYVEPLNDLELAANQEDWRRSLHQLIHRSFCVEVGDAVGSGIRDNQSPQQQQQQQQQLPTRPQYSSSGRLQPRSSYSLGSRRSSRSSSRSSCSTGSHILKQQQQQQLLLDAFMLSLLQQVLQTNNSEAVKQWLLTASERELALMSDICSCAVANRDGVFQQAAIEADASASAAAAAAEMRSERLEKRNRIRDDIRLPPIHESVAVSPSDSEAAARTGHSDILVIRHDDDKQDLSVGKQEQLEEHSMEAVKQQNQVRSECASSILDIIEGGDRRTRNVGWSNWNSDEKENLDAGNNDSKPSDNSDNYDDNKRKKPLPQPPAGNTTERRPIVLIPLPASTLQRSSSRIAKPGGKVTSMWHPDQSLVA